jgi:glycosyltransferase involved in cell wall biosynthesis
VRLSLFVPSMRGGGAERVMLTLASEFARRGHGVDLVLASAEGPYLADVPETVRVVDLGSRRVVASLPALIRYLRRERPEAMLSAMGRVNVVALWARRLAGAKTRLVVSEHNTLSLATQGAASWRQRFMPWLEHLFYPWADGIVAVSSGVAEDLSQIARLPRGEIEVIYNPFPVDEIARKAEEPLEHPGFEPGGPPVVLGVGRMMAQKDFPALLRAFARVRSVRPARLLILGEGEDRPRLEALARELGVAGDVLMPGFVENPYSYMRRSSVLVLSSAWEGLPSVLIEALACGCPVVSTDCPSGPREILADGRYGTLVPVGDDGAMAEGILSALDAPAEPGVLRARAAELCKDDVPDRYLKALTG